MKTYAPLDIDAFKFLIASLNLRHFKWWEFLVATDSVKDGAKNSLPPTDLMLNIVPLALVADETRERLGVPLELRSVYRNPEYNAAWGGKPFSSHKDFTAGDVGVVGSKSPDDARRLEREISRLIDRPIVCPIELDFPRAPHPLWRSFKPTGLTIESTGGGTAFVFKGGLKAYQEANNPFVHVDARGWNARW